MEECILGFEKIISHKFYTVFGYMSIKDMAVGLIVLSICVMILCSIFGMGDD